MTDETLPVPVAHNVSLGVVQADAPSALVRSATEAARPLADVIEKQKLYTKIQGRKYVNVEGWLTLSTMMGCLPVEVSNAAREDGAYEAVVELRRMSDGQVLARASHECGGPSDRTWKDRPAYARRSMAATRATSKACRLAFSWVMALSGYATTPVEEMDDARPCAPREQQQPDVITAGQVKLIGARMTAAGVAPPQLKRILANHGYQSRKAIKRGDLDKILEDIARTGAANQDTDNRRPEDIEAETDSDIPF